MNGLWIHDARTSRFADYAPTLLPQWDALWWMIGVQSGPIDSTWFYESEPNQAFFDDCHAFDLHGTVFDRVWRPSSIQILAPHLLVDEWSYFCGIEAPDVESAERRVRHLDAAATLKSLLDGAEGRAEIVIIDVDDGLLFVFSPREDWLDVLAAQSKSAQRISSPEDWQNWRGQGG